jgi:hypothetical protein
MLTLLWILASVLPGAPAQIPEITAPEVYVSIQPSWMEPYQLLRRKTPDTYTCRATVTQAETSAIYLSAELFLHPGETQKTSRTVAGHTLDFAVTMKNRRAESVVTVRRGEKLLTRQRSTIYLPTPEGVVPLR